MYLRRMQKVNHTLKVDGALKIKSFRRGGRFEVGEFNWSRSVGKLAIRRRGRRVRGRSTGAQSKHRTGAAAARRQVREYMSE